MSSIVAPQTAGQVSKSTEQLVSGMWRKALGPKARDASGRILELSVGLQRMYRFLNDIEQTFGVKIRPTTAMQLGSVQAIANAIDTDVWPAPSSLVKMRDGDEGEILFVVAAASGVVLELCDLVQLITFPGQIMGLQLPGLAGETKPLASVLEIAEHYKKVILNAAPATKIHIIGYSFGGLVTLELARTLRRDGHPVGLVGVLDSTCYEKYWPKSEWIKAAVKRTKRKMNEIKKSGSVSEAVTFAAHCIHLAKLYAKRRLRRGTEAAVPKESAYYIDGLDPHFQAVRDMVITAFEAYNPPLYDGHIVLFRSEFGDPNACDSAGIWKHKVADMQLVQVSGTHATMIRKPFVQTLADKISMCLPS